MIDRLHVDGFRSLTNFNIGFQPGLNVLVGPNGSGKTNVVLFFEFLSQLMSSEASTAVYKAGGAGAIFRKEGGTYHRRITAELKGRVDYFQHEFHSGKPEVLRSTLDYEYSFALVLSPSLDKVNFDTQSMKIRIRDNSNQTNIFDDSNLPSWNVSLSVRVDEHDKPIVDVQQWDKAIELPMFMRNKADEIGGIELSITNLLSNSPIALPLFFSRFNLQCRSITEDLSGGQIFNIVPSNLKIPEDSAKPPGLSRDGGGLAATLFAAQKHVTPNTYGFFYDTSPTYHSSAIKQIKEYLKLVNPAISDFEATNDAYENQVRVRFEIISGDYKATLPMSLMSDGTLKWLALITAAVTNNSILCIEEPENYLHPQMQSKMIDIFRQILFDSKQAKFTLLTTHSETLLNHCRPEELILVSMENGMTRARRCINSVDIDQEIKRTGFGLGYYYITDALQDE